MRKNKIATTIGTINLNDVNFCEESLDVFIGIDSVSADIQEKINEAVEIAKAEYSWNGKDTKLDLSLWIHIKRESISYCISIDIIDKANDLISTEANIDVDLSEYQSELKKVIVKAMIDNFF